MGNIVICADHPSNEFFKKFPNCRTYSSKRGFVAAVLGALSEEAVPPTPLTEAQRRELSWEAATERFLAAAELGPEEPAGGKPVASSPPFLSVSMMKLRELRRSIEGASALVHHTISGNETARRAFGAIPGSLRPDEQQCKELGLRLPVGSPG